jgi:hypothetical protein
VSTSCLGSAINQITPLRLVVNYILEKTQIQNGHL